MTPAYLAAALAVLGGGPTLQFLAEATPEELAAVAPLVLWSGVVVNGVAPFLQVHFAPFALHLSPFALHLSPLASHLSLSLSLSRLTSHLHLPSLQVGGQQAVGPARAQVIYASGPLWAALLSLVLLGETVGAQGVLGGAAFLAAVLLAATAPSPDPDCEEDLCEI